MVNETMASTPILEVRNICKRFPGVRALHNVCLHLDRGEVLALLGENGAGKSTLMKILAGIQPPDSGQIMLDGSAASIDSVRSATVAGIVLIHQELNLSANLDVGANIFLGREPRRFGIIDRETIDRQSAEVLRMVGLNISPRTLTGMLSIGKQQMVEIAKALSVNARVLIMDEPTSSLSATETEALFHVVKDLRQKGVSIIYISHRLGEVNELADRVTVMRDGENAGELARDEIEHDRMVQMMVGRDVSRFYARQSHSVGKVVLEARNLTTPAHPEHELNFSVRAGEIVGVYGLVGSGRTELLRVLFAVDRPTAGEVKIDGVTAELNNPHDAIRCGIALVPEDRKLQGLVVDMTVRENIGMASLKKHRIGGLFLNGKAERSVADEMISKLRIKTPSPRQISRFLSGGNQQKVVLGKWLSMTPRILLLDEPTRGIDVGAKEEIYQLMEQLAETGVAVFFVSSEMEEILGMSDRALVMHEGRITGELSREQLSEEAIMHLGTGGDSNSMAKAT